MTAATDGVYDDNEVVSNYADREAVLLMPEKEVLERFTDRLKHMDFLDLGVGAGRTATHFMPAVRSYTGIDISEPMVETCRRRFRDGRFMVADARDLSAFGDGSFDFVLFSFNGIDHVNKEGREKVLKEVWRVLRPEGIFLFSSHNSAFDLRARHGFRWHPSPLETWRSFRRWCFFRLLNPGYALLRARPTMYVWDGAESFRLAVFYGYASAILGELRKYGFGNIEIRSGQSGERLEEGEADKASEPWLYYLCHKRPSRKSQDD